jgi:hypothetical protein
MSHTAQTIDTGLDETAPRSLETFVKSHWTILTVVVGVIFGAGAFGARIEATQAFQGEEITGVKKDVKDLNGKFDRFTDVQEKYHIDTVQHMSELKGLLEKQSKQ